MAAPGVPSNRLTLKIDGEEVAPSVSRAIVTSAASDADFVSFADAAAGGAREYRLALTFVQDLQTGSLWDQIWSHSGDEVDVTVRPYGNTTATAAQPHFDGTVVISQGDGDLIGGEADTSVTARFVTEVEWVFTAKPARRTTGTAPA